MYVFLHQQYYSSPIQEIFALEEKISLMSLEGFVQIFGRFVHRDSKCCHCYFLPVTEYVWGNPLGVSNYTYHKVDSPKSTNMLATIELNSGSSPAAVELL